MIKIALVDPDPQFESEIERLLEERSDMVLVARARSLNHALAVVEEYHPEVLLIGPGMGVDISMTFTKKLTARHPIGCIMLTFDLPAYHKQAASRASIVDVIHVPVDPDKLITAIQISAGYSRQLAIKEETATEIHNCPIITVFSTKGGVGKTVLSTNIATSIASSTEGRPVLIDLDLQFGDIGIAMGMTPERTILDFVDQMQDLSSLKLDDLLTTHDSGVKLILAPKQPESADIITSEHVSLIINALKDYADFIIIDTPASFNDGVLAALDVTDEICLVLTLDLFGLKNTKLCLKTLHELKYAPEKQKLILNRVESHVGLGAHEVEKVLGMRALATIISDKAVPLSINKGVPVVQDDPKSQVSKEIMELAQYYVHKYRPDLVRIAEAS